MSHKLEIDRHGSTIEYHNRTKADIPDLDLLTLLFDSPHNHSQESTVIHADAENASLKLTKAEARTYTRRIAYTLQQKYGIKGEKDNRSVVTVISSGNFFLPIIFYGVVASGAIFSSVSAASTSEELARLIKSAPSDLVICSPEIKDVAVAAARQSNVHPKRVLITDAENKTIRDVNGQSILGEEEREWERLTDRKAIAERVLCLIYSSGTTGLPKGVPLTHQNVVAQVILGAGIQRPHIYRHHPNFKYVTLAHLPVAHIAGMQGFMINPFFMGGTTYWMPRFDFVKFLEYNKKYGVSIFFTVPPIYLLIAKSPAVKDHFKTMVVAFTGAAPMKKELQEAAARKLGEGKVFINQTWGLSESTGSVTLMDFGERDDSGSVSRLLPNMSARIVSEDGQDLGPDEEGEIYVKGPVIFRGYHNNPKANAEAFDKDGWFKTGDVGVFKNDLLYIVDRKKELIKYKGNQVAPAELEGLLMSHPDILDAAVIGVEADHTEVPRAYVVVEDKNKMTEEKIKAFVKENVATYKQLRGGVIYLEAIPKSPSGKILRKDLRTLAKQKKEAPKAKL